MSELRFDGQVAIVTGAGSGIGRATALLLAGRGARILVNDAASDGRAEQASREIREQGGEAVTDLAEIGSPESARAVVAAALERFGRIDILVNNAGISRPGPFVAASDAEIDRVMAVNLAGPFALMRAAWPAMHAQGYGRILNMASSAALGTGISGPYAVSKAGILGLTKDAGISGKPLGICVNALLPQAHTPLLDNHPDPAFRAWMRDNFRPEHVAAAIAFLVSPAMQASGEIFAAGGGRVARVAFLESRGHFDPDLTPESVRDHFDDVSDLSDPTILVTQADHEAIHDALFPGRPGAR
jgi:NAD(P)-dependent dehydrogenase (short-subunit alcohol dehydrogenase family)